MFETITDNPTRGSRLINHILNNMMVQWVTETMRYRGEDQPSPTHLVLMETDLVSDKEYKCHIGKSDYLIQEMVMRAK